MPVLNPGAGPTLARFTQTPRATSPGNTLLASSFEGGTSGVTLTGGAGGNTGGVSGNAFDVVSIGAGCTLAFDNAHSAHGGMACQVATTTTATTVIAEWTTSAGPLGTAWFRVYLFFTAFPVNSVRPFTARSGGSLAACVNILPTGKITLLNAVSSTVSTFTGTIPLNQWFRLEGYVVGDPSAGSISCSQFNSMDSGTADETRTSAATNTTGLLTQYWYGNAASSTGIGPFWMDDAALSSVGFPGPAAIPDLGGATVAQQFHPGAGPTAARFFTTPRDTGSGSFAAPPLADAGSAVDALAVAAAVPLAEAGTGTETLAVTATATLAEAGSGADTLAVTAAVPLAETGSGAEARTAAVAALEPGTAASQFHPGAGPSAARFFQTPRATDSPAGIISLAETGTAADSLTVTVTLPLAEAGSAADTLAVTATVPLADAGSAADTVLITAAVPLAELASAADTLAVSILPAAVLPDGVRPGGFHPGPGPTLARFWTSPRASDTPVPALAFTVGSLSASDAPAAVLTTAGASSALTASTAASGTLTTATQATGGPS